MSTLQRLGCQYHSSENAFVEPKSSLNLSLCSCHSERRALLGGLTGKQPKEVQGDQFPDAVDLFRHCENKIQSMESVHSSRKGRVGLGNKPKSTFPEGTWLKGSNKTLRQGFSSREQKKKAFPTEVRERVLEWKNGSPFLARG